MSDAGIDPGADYAPPQGPSDPQTMARASGYSWGDIFDHISQSTDAALQQGYTQDEVDRHLGYQDPADFKARSTNGWAATMANDPKILDGLASLQPELDLTQSPSLLSDYSRAILNREVKGPQDFAEHYAAAALEAAHDIHGLDDSNLDDVHARQAAGAMAADQVAAQLPANRDLTDAALSLWGGSDSDYSQVQQNFLQHWQDTGQNPIDAAAKAQTDQALNDKLISNFRYDPATDADKARDAIQKFYFVPGEELPDAKSVHDALIDVGIDVATVTGLSLAGKYVVGPLARLAMNKLGEIPEWLGSMMEKAPATVVDTSKPAGEAITEAPWADALAAPKPAERERPGPRAGSGEAASKFVETATPAEKMEALTREHLQERLGVTAAELENMRLTREGVIADEFDRPNFFQNLAKNEDPETQTLAAGHDTTASWLKWISDVWRDESGSVPGITPRPEETELQPGTRRATILGKNTAEDLIRQYATGMGTQKSEALANGMEGFFKGLAPFMPRWRAELEKPFGGGAADTEIGQLLNAIEGNGIIAPDNPFAPYARARAEMHASNVADLEAAVERGEMNPVQLRDFYISHIYTDESIRRVQGVTGGGNRTGSLGFTKQRTIPTYAEALADGYKPKYDNPILMDIAGIDAQQKALATLRMQALAKDANWMRYYTDTREAARDGFERIFGLNSEKIASTVTPEGEPGPPVVQRLYAPKGFSNIWNNWTQFENMQRSQVAASIEDALLKMKNTSTYLKLMFPGYHTITLYKEGMANGLANALDELRGGEIARGVWDAATIPFKPFEYVWRAAQKYRPMYHAMEADPALDAFVAGGGAIGGRTKVYAASSEPSIWRLWNRGELGQAIGQDFRNAFTFPRTRAGEGVRGVATDLGNAATLPFREIGRVASQITAPLWDHGVPLIKSGAAMERIQTFIRQNGNASDDAVRNFARQVVTNIEDRFGEYNSANMFWKPWLKRAANQAMLSTGWTYGTVEATLRGLGYRPMRGFEWDPVATTNLASQFAMIALTNAAWSYAVDGKLPSSTLDYMIPFANARGIARILLPGEEKEYYDWMKILAESYSVGKDKGLAAGFQQFFQSGKDYARGKLAPVWQAGHDWFTGEDAIGHKIAYTPGGIAGWLENEFLPIFATNWKSSERIGLSYTQNLFGLRQAPKWLENWNTWREGQQRLHDYWSRQELQRANKENGATSGTWYQGTGGGGSSRGTAAQTPPPGGWGNYESGAGAYNPPTIIGGGQRGQLPPGIAAPRQSRRGGGGARQPRAQRNLLPRGVYGVPVR